MSTRRERRVTYYLPGSLFPETTDHSISDGPDVVARAAAEAPAGAFCFTISTVLVADPIPDGEGGTLKVQPKTVETSGRYYLGGRLFDEADLENLSGDHRILRANMRGQWEHVILTPLGNWQPFEARDVLLGAAS